jgi:hypothetical protein
VLNSTGVEALRFDWLPGGRGACGSEIKYSMQVVSINRRIGFIKIYDCKKPDLHKFPLVVPTLETHQRVN